jgi:hypothetical protein
MKSRNVLLTRPFIDRMTGASLGVNRILDDVVICPPTNVHGNFVDPNPWGYTIDRHRYHYGTSRWYTSFSNFQKDIPYRLPYGPPGNGGVSIPPYNRTDLYNSALSRAYDKLRGDLDLAVDLAERAQTYRMFRQLRRWERYLGGWGPRRWANEWLEYQYGWRPLLSSCYGAANELVGNKTQRKNRTITSVAKETFSDFRTRRGFANIGQVDMLTTCKGKAGCRITLWYEAAGGILDAARWSSLNPVSIAWELMPYSFVVDWFYDIGSTLRNLETSYLYNRFVSGYIDELYAVEAKEEFHSWGQPFTEVYQYDTKAYRRRIEFSRSVLSSAPLPQLPQFKVKLGWQRWISAWALSSQVLLGRSVNPNRLRRELTVPRGKP